MTLHAEVDTGWRKTPILVADLMARRRADEPFVMFSGHHDTWYYGVMDNGGANATMLEVARLCRASAGPNGGAALRVIFWSGHSQGRYSSSAWYADDHWEELERRALVHVNVDSTGGKGNTVVADADSLGRAAQPRARGDRASRAAQKLTGRRMSRAGDQSFWGIGVPSIFGNMSEQPADAAQPMPRRRCSAAASASATAPAGGGTRRTTRSTRWTRQSWCATRGSTCTCCGGC